MHTFPDQIVLPPWFYKRSLWHLAFWATYVLVSAIDEYTVTVPVNQGLLQMTILGHVILVILTYITTFFAVPILFYKRRYLLYVLFGLILSVSMTTLFAVIWRLLGLKLVIEGTAIDDPKMIEGASIYIFFYLFITALKLIKDLLFAQHLRAEQETQNLKGELSALRQQISPHFLLNALNTIYGLALTEPKRVAPTVLQLSELLRFTLYETQSETVPLDKELKFVQDVIALQSVRASEKLKVHIEIPTNILEPAPPIAPLILLVFVENAFKYAQMNTNAERFLHISVKYNAHERVLNFYTENSFSTLQKAGPDGGLGLENVQRRLELLYPERHILSITSDSGIWKVHLKMTLK
jgi:two-component system, LytTR family, sensor kinase